MAAIWSDYPSLVAPVTFTKGPEILIVEECGNLEVVLTFVGAEPQVLRFSDPTTAAFFQSDLERELLQAAWTVDLSDLRSLCHAAVMGFEMPERGPTPAR
jgi:hypothetical protein